MVQYKHRTTRLKYKNVGLYPRIKVLYSGPRVLTVFVWRQLACLRMSSTIVTYLMLSKYYKTLVIKG